MGEMLFKQRLSDTADTSRGCHDTALSNRDVVHRHAIRLHTIPAGNSAAEARISGQRSVMLMRVTDHAQSSVATASFWAFSVNFRAEAMPYKP